VLIQASCPAGLDMQRFAQPRDEIPGGGLRGERKPSQALHAPKHAGAHGGKLESNIITVKYNMGVYL